MSVVGLPAQDKSTSNVLNTETIRMSLHSANSFQELGLIPGHLLENMRLPASLTGRGSVSGDQARQLQHRTAAVRERPVRQVLYNCPSPMQIDWFPLWLSLRL